MRFSRTVHSLPIFTHCIGLAYERGMTFHSCARVIIPLMMLRRSSIMYQDEHSWWSQSRTALLSFRSDRRASFQRGRIWLSSLSLYFSRVGFASLTLGLST